MTVWVECTVVFYFDNPVYDLVCCYDSMFYFDSLGLVDDVDAFVPAGAVSGSLSGWSTSVTHNDNGDSSEDDEVSH